MKALAVSIILTLTMSGIAQAQQARGVNLPPNLFGSVSQGTVSTQPITLSIGGAIDRALQYNLGGVIAGEDVRVARAARLRALSELLPKVNGSVTETIQQVNLAAFGFGGFPGIPQVIGPF